jgi:molecular chaperone IbpA
MAVAGFGPQDVDLVVKENTLVVSGKLATPPAKTEILHRGIATRAFERRFVLADHIVVQGADLQHGLLSVSLKRVVPEALKPRRITIGSAQPATTQTATIEQTVANDSHGEAQAA